MSENRFVLFVLPRVEGLRGSGNPFPQPVASCTVVAPVWQRLEKLADRITEGRDLRILVPLCNWIERALCIGIIPLTCTVEDLDARPPTLPVEADLASLELDLWDVGLVIVRRIRDETGLKLHLQTRRIPSNVAVTCVTLSP